MISLADYLQQIRWVSGALRHHKENVLAHTIFILLFPKPGTCSFTGTDSENMPLDLYYREKICKYFQHAGIGLFGFFFFHWFYLFYFSLKYLFCARTFRYVLGSTFYIFPICICRVSHPLEKRLTLCFLCLVPNLALKQESLSGSAFNQIHHIFGLEKAAEKCTSPCVEICAPVKSVTNIVIQPTCERNATWTNLLPITSVKCQGSDSPED